ncbi:MAG: alanine--tRNA ligase [Bacillota bacterium]|jgi:alanyl-tRNA synthetase
MKKLSGKEIREKYINYFINKGHTHVPSSSLIPYDDQTLIFTNAGMVQFKNIFLGLEKRPYKRAVTAQRCVRAGGKHNDLDTVGRTARHHTFFEMLGNFSFGDYFKRDAILFCWDFVTNELGLPKEKLYATIYEKDDEAFKIWCTETDINSNHVLRIGEKDNFWSMGPTGPCGPCSEIFIDRGPQYGCEEPICGIGHCDCDRYMEIWNLVFMQFDRQEDGTLLPLPQPSIDTGMGLERVAAVMQQVDSNYDTDLLKGLIEKICLLCNKTYDKGEEGFPFRVIADHARSCSFLIADGVIPSNEGRGYVLRRILRRAVRFGKTLGLDEPFLYKLVDDVDSSLGETYPILTEKKDLVKKMIKIEEERFLTTLNEGLALAEDIIAQTKSKGATVIDGRDAFTLYDTFGFPVDLTKDLAEENGLMVDEKGFENAMAAQREKARMAHIEDNGDDELNELSSLLVSMPVNKFVGYDNISLSTKIKAIVINNKEVDQAVQNDTGWLILEKYPFYAESGGQIGDKGTVKSSHGQMKILDSKKLPSGMAVQKFVVTEGRISSQESVMAEVEIKKRAAIACNHSATHLLNQALRKNLGDHVQQAGSLVDDNRLRFDFSHFNPISTEELAKIEADVNEQIFANLSIECKEMPLEEAKKSGALAFFGDKYGDIVRVVKMGDYSQELCGGTHCQSTGQIGLIKILSESGIAAGLRRIEALTGQEAVAYYKEQEKTLANIAGLLKTQPSEVEKRVAKILEENRHMAKIIEQTKEREAKNSMAALISSITEAKDLKILIAQAEAINDMPTLRTAMDFFRNKGVDIIILAATDGEKVYIVASVSSKGQAASIFAGDLVKEIASVCGGSGGGKKDIAQAGGKNPDKIADAIKKAQNIIADKLS